MKRETAFCFESNGEEKKWSGLFLICNDAGDPSDDTWSSRIDGMRIYSKENLADVLSRNGFSDIRCDTHPNGWICVSAVKKRQ
jgi:hypothetical protein